MKSLAPALIMLLILATGSCVDTETQRSLQQQFSQTTTIRIGYGFNYSNGSTNEQDRLAITDPVQIREFARCFSFGSEHDISVKHPLSAYIHFDSATGTIASVRFEHRVMRFGNREYYLSTRTTRMLDDMLKKQ